MQDELQNDFYNHTDDYICYLRKQGRYILTFWKSFFHTLRIMCYLINYELPNLVPQTCFHKPVGVDALESLHVEMTRRGVRYY